jgi:hypothetical protein
MQGGNFKIQTPALRKTSNFKLQDGGRGAHPGFEQARLGWNLALPASRQGKAPAEPLAW